jgi:hypothetical protein
MTTSRVVRSIMHVKRCSDKTPRCEPDIHADTTVAGSNMRMIEASGEVVSIAAYSDEVAQLKNIPIASAGTVYESTENGDLYLLVFHECIFLGPRIHNSLICPNQLRYFGLSMEDTPYRYGPMSLHVIHVPKADLNILMSSDCGISYFDTRLSTEEEINTLPRIEMTSPLPWDPKSMHFTRNEESAERGTEHRPRIASIGYVSSGLKDMIQPEPQPLSVMLT